MVFCLDLTLFIKYCTRIKDLKPSANFAFLLEFTLELIEGCRLIFFYFLFAYETHVTNDPNFNKQLLILYSNIFVVGASLLSQVTFFIFLVHNLIFPFFSIPKQMNFSQTAVKRWELHVSLRCNGRKQVAQKMQNKRQ